ncbi:MAG: EscF/YscF/HrpA family type III secretion system needle major subunit [Burkholderiales bacterium]
MLFTTPTSFTLDNINTYMGAGLQQLDQQLTQAMQQIANNPSPSPKDLAIFQAQMQMYTNLIQMESSIFKVYGDTTRQVVTNMSS